MKKRIRMIRITVLFTLFLGSIMAMLSTVPVYAGSEKGSIEIVYKGRTDSKEEVILSGADFEIFPVQTMEDGALVWNGEFAASGVSLEDESAGAREEQAKKLWEYAKKKKLSGVTQVTNDTGHAQFMDLEDGIYLLALKEPVYNGTDRFESAPFLVSLPSKMDGALEYHVIIEPKVEWNAGKEPSVRPDEPEKIPEKVPETTPPAVSGTNGTNPIQTILNSVKTGDVTTFAWVWLALLGGVMIILSLRRRKK